MKISTEINSIVQFVGFEDAIRLVADAGFDAWDFSMHVMACYDWRTGKVYESGHPLNGDGYLEYAYRLGEIAKECGIVCNQSHSPYPVYVPEVAAKAYRAIDCTAAVGGDICVIHPLHLSTAAENAEYFAPYLAYAKEKGVRIAVENMYGWDNAAGHASPAACSSPQSFIEHLEAVGDPSFVACLDIGHAEMMHYEGVTAVDMINALGGKYIKALHMHDNDRCGDKHQIPFSMDIDFEPIVKALKKTGYDGYFTLEAVGYLAKHSPNDIKGGVKKLAAAARRLADMYESY
ncbi:MAG: sugar phosphate isomerase/epimerase [Clostridia bacterium]|nr:sugar phosphate isomerase/epimerase [Clostridia bacterium]